jgi:lipopolysaccharide export LptBFGC system permease protein LptF
LCRFIFTASPGFTSIWLIFDVSDNISSFIDNHIPLSLVVRYYATQIPQVFIILLPVALLLSLLFALGRMSRSNEIVSMLTAGVSLPRVLLPLIGIGLLTVAASMALNYSLAPHAELARKTFLSEAQSRPGAQHSGASLSQSNRLAHLVYPEFSPWRQPVQQRAGAATGREGQYRHELFGRPGLLSA